MAHNNKYTGQNWGFQDFQDYNFGAGPPYTGPPQSRGAGYGANPEKAPLNNIYGAPGSDRNIYQRDGTTAEPYSGPVTWESICSAFSTRAYPEEPSIFEGNPSIVLG